MNGSSREEQARADRIRERSGQLQRGTDNAMRKLERAKLVSEADVEENSEITLNKEGLRARGVPRWAIGVAVVLVAAGAAAGVAWFVLSKLH